jgi:type II secretory pathway pseudopilin PulG
MFYFNLKKNKGFTLLEALVATSILMVAVAAPITIAQKGLSSAIYSKNQMIASYLAQDAIEYIKNVRDQNFIANISSPNSVNWLGGLDYCLGENSCQIDTVVDLGVGQIIPFTDSPNGILSKNTTDVFYGFQGTPTNFKREINIVEENNVKALITVKVSWGGVSDNVEVKTLIYNI